jgi:hypothetical protein
LTLFITPDQFETSGIENGLVLAFCAVFCAVFSSAAVLPASLGGLRLPRSTAFAHHPG